MSAGIDTGASGALSRASELMRQGALDAAEAMVNDALARMTTDEGTHRHTTPLLPSVHAPALVIMGSKDPDFPDPAAEARFTADQLGGPAEVLMIEGAGHYPQAEAVDEVAPAVAAFLAKLA